MKSMKMETEVEKIPQLWDKQNFLNVAAEKIGCV